MGMWGFGAFDNDDAADFAARFGKADPSDRADLLASAFAEAMAAGDELEDFAAPALAAAAIVAAKLPGAALPESGYGPRSLAEFAWTPPPGLVSAALRAFDHVVTAEPDWAELYADAEGDGAELAQIRAALAAAAA